MQAPHRNAAIHFPRSECHQMTIMRSSDNSILKIQSLKMPKEKEGKETSFPAINKSIPPKTAAN